MKITIEIDEKELKGLLFGETEPKITNPYRDVVYEEMITAVNVLEKMLEVASEYKCVTVDDFIDILHDKGIDKLFKKSYSTETFGWKHEDLIRCKVSRTRHGYAIILPDPVQL